MKKTNLLSLAFIIVISFFLTACPLITTVPLSEPTIKVDESIIGDWLLEDYGEVTEYLNVTRINDNEFRLEQFLYEDEEVGFKSYNVYTCHFTDIGKTRFVNAFHEEEQVYYIYKIDLTGETLEVNYVTPYIDEVFTSSAELYAFFEKHQHLSFFYTSEEYTYTKGKIEQKSSKVESIKSGLGNQLNSN